MSKKYLETFAEFVAKLNEVAEQTAHNKKVQLVGDMFDIVENYDDEKLPTLKSLIEQYRTDIDVDVGAIKNEEGLGLIDIALPEHVKLVNFLKNANV